MNQNNLPDSLKMNFESDANSGLISEVNQLETDLLNDNQSETDLLNNIDLDTDLLSDIHLDADLLNDIHSDTDFFDDIHLDIDLPNNNHLETSVEINNGTVDVNGLANASYPSEIYDNQNYLPANEYQNLKFSPNAIDKFQPNSSLLNKPQLQNSQSNNFQLNQTEFVNYQIDQSQIHQLNDNQNEAKNDHSVNIFYQQNNGPILNPSNRNHSTPENQSNNVISPNINPIFTMQNGKHIYEKEATSSNENQHLINCTKNSLSAVQNSNQIVCTDKLVDINKKLIEESIIRPNYPIFESPYKVIKNTFPYKLFNLINSSKTNIINWSDDGKTFEINLELFQRHYLSEKNCFRINRLDTFLFTLKIYGFIRKKNFGKPFKQKFCHPFFLRDDKKSLQFIHRRVRN